MAVANISAQLQTACFALFLTIFPFEVQTKHFARGKSVTSAKATRSAEAFVARIIERTEEGDAAIIGEASGKEFLSITVLITPPQIGINDPRLIQLALRHDV